MYHVCLYFCLCVVCICMCSVLLQRAKEWLGSLLDGLQMSQRVTDTNRAANDEDSDSLSDFDSDSFKVQDQD